MIPVTRPFIPDRKRLDEYIDGIYESNWLTNDGPLVQRLTRELEEYLAVENMLLVANGTLALQVAYRVLGVSRLLNKDTPEAITTPFSFAATSSSLCWEGVKPVFSDIDEKTWCLDPSKISEKVNARTKAIVPVHVYGNGCDVESIAEISERFDLKVIYDAAHAFNVRYRNKSLLNWGDAATLSFHATKVFHTIEGGAIIFRRKEDLESAKAMINFGFTENDIKIDGINAKMNEFQAAMGLAVLEQINENLDSRSRAWSRYKKALHGYQLQERSEQCTNNSAYFPVLMKTEEELEKVIRALELQGASARRYFYPSLDSVYGEEGDCPISQSVSRRILCLPLYSGMDESDQDLVIRTMEKAAK